MKMERLNKLALETGSATFFLPLVKFLELEPDCAYKITHARKVKTKSGQKIVVHLDDQYQMFLPDLVSKAALRSYRNFTKENVCIVSIEKKMRFIKMNKCN